MKLVICCNHSYPHCGGSEKVVQQIAESMAGIYSHDVTVVSRSLHKPIQNNSVKYIPCERDPGRFVNQIKKLNPDHVHTYSDCFTYWPEILFKGSQIPGKKSIALVGMNQMKDSIPSIKRLKSSGDWLTLITHSDNYQDYRICKDSDIPVTVIPNGVNLSEFDNNDLPAWEPDVNRKVILCVSNFFPGKGQEHLVEVLKRLHLKRQDWLAVFMSANVNFLFAKHLSRQVQVALNRADFKSMFLCDIPRGKLISSLKSCDVFAFPSQKEVAPLVLLEAQAAGKPWVGLPVGNATTLKGGLLATPASKDKHGYYRYSEETYNTFVDHIDSLLDGDKAKLLGEIGRKEIEDKYNWSLIASKYNEVFTK